MCGRAARRLFAHIVPAELHQPRVHQLQVPGWRVSSSAGTEHTCFSASALLLSRCVWNAACAASRCWGGSSAYPEQQMIDVHLLQASGVIRACSGRSEGIYLLIFLAVAALSIVRLQ